MERICKKIGCFLGRWEFAFAYRQTTAASKFWSISAVRTAKLQWVLQCVASKRSAVGAEHWGHVPASAKTKPIESDNSVVLLCQCVKVVEPKTESTSKAMREYQCSVVCNSLLGDVCIASSVHAIDRISIRQLNLTTVECCFLNKTRKKGCLCRQEGLVARRNPQPTE